MKLKYLCLTFVALCTCTTTSAAIRITEWMYQGNPDESIVAPEAGEFVELTNVGASPIDMTGWLYDDDSRNADPAASFDLSPFGTVLPGESVVFTDWNADLFKAAWALGPDVDVIGFSEPGLGRNDEINIYDASGALVDRLTYGDRDFPGTPRTRQFSANIPFAALGLNDVNSAVLSETGDIFGSYVNSRSEVGSPGVYTVPEPSSLAMISALGLLFVRRRFL